MLVTVGKAASNVSKILEIPLVLNFGSLELLQLSF